MRSHSDVSVGETQKMYMYCERDSDVTSQWYVHKNSRVKSLTVYYEIKNPCEMASQIHQCRF